MSQRSSIDDLPDTIRTAIHAAIERGATIDGITAMIRDMGGDASRSAVGRYTAKFTELAKQQRDMRSVAEAFGREFGNADDMQGRMMIQLMTSITTRMLMPHLTGEAEEELTALDVSRMAKAVKDATGAAKIDIERERAIREETARRTREEAAASAETAARAAGASEDTLRAVRMGILGMAA